MILVSTSQPFLFLLFPALFFSFTFVPSSNTRAVLEFLATRPDQQGRGVGKALLRWGMDHADKQQRRIYLEATTPGFPLYAKMGWKPLEEAEIDYARWGGEGKQVLTLMARDPLPC
jgi:predicted N-acetyltransferase YhbS